MRKFIFVLLLVTAHFSLFTIFAREAAAMAAAPSKKNQAAKHVVAPVKNNSVIEDKDKEVMRQSTGKIPIVSLRANEKTEAASEAWREAIPAKIASSPAALRNDTTVPPPFTDQVHKEFKEVKEKRGASAVTNKLGQLMDELKDKNAALQVELDNLTSHKKELLKKLKNTMEENETLKNQISEFQTKLNDADKDKKQMSEDREQKARAISQLNEKNSRLEKEIGSVKEESIAAEKKRRIESEKQQVEIAKWQKRVDEVENRLKVSQDENSRLSKELQSQKKIVDNQSSQAEAALNNLKIITKQNSALKDEVATLQTGLVNLDKDKRRIAEDREQKARAISQLNEKIGYLEKGQKTELENHKTELVKLQKKTDELEKNLAASRDKEFQLTKELQNQKKVFDKENSQSQAMFEQLQKKEKILLAEKAELNESLNDVLKKFADSNKELTRLRKESADMHYNLGVIFYKENKFNEAITEYEKVLEIKPDDADVHYNLALIYDTVKNDRPKALVHYQQYLNIRPNDSDELKIRERITELNAENKIWDESRTKGIGQEEKLGRW